MGKNEKGTPKEIANRCKSKGLQRLRWFCQMCQKQCRDQNGFKCHLTSEAHQRQLLLFAENPDTYLKEYSEEFEKNFMKVLRSTFGTKRVRANEVYQEYIRDKMHIHMNSTTWHTLTNFVIYLGKSGKCHVDQTEKGWFIAWIDQEEELKKQQAYHKVKAIYDDEERQQQLVQEQAERAREKLEEDSSDAIITQPTKILRSADDEKVAFSLGGKKPTPEELSRPSTSAFLTSHSVFKPKAKNGIKTEIHSSADSASKKRKSYKDSELDEKHYEKKGRNVVPKQLTALEEIREMEERRKERQNRKNYWLHKGIVVKVLTKKLGSEFYKAKGVVKELLDEYNAVLEIDGNCIEVNQDDLETVIPAIGRQMLIVNGAYRGTRAVLQEMDERKYCVILRIDEGFAKGRVINIPYEDASKLS